MKELILHIGSTKTGSSAIQKFLWENRDALQSCGILYPDVGIASNAHHLLAAAIHPSAWRMHSTVFDGKDRPSYFRELVIQLCHAASESPADKIFLSSEYQWGRMGQEFFSEIETLRRSFDLRLLCYIRRQDEWLESTYVQSVKFGETRTFREWLLAKLDRDTCFCQYDVILRQWERLVRPEHIHIRLYETSKGGADSVSDVLDFLGIQDRGSFIFPAEVTNPSPMPLETEILRLINCSNIKPNNKHKLRRSLLTTCQKKEPHARFHYLSVDEVIQLLKRYEAGNFTIAQKYFNSSSGRLFESPLPNAGEWRPRPALAPEELSTKIVELFSKLLPD